ncbi:N-acylglucosamine 2-epimerase [Ameyamaea chiangmaiensis NBRC 103196]|uniref:AGE family epimerase/isomerase n=1 Tax=Ameyamaea chiangmaiensis TaxID=442969 RepID=A0A850PGI0_9PROT|nr:AGE family epimerase/isomerase [Ameyamaea chiangmaiensis]MBS4075698.1 AGE family epimerase/isomerase [Ameyamaea chiangmaiensis]NVN40271.1 AGE family epimerase/isomerase [Ameyamaea chiangmaiensis]GBQ70470.1 N-acylglucosamine 2-epimerase [Ameyamaea chiangmaiensis NBRC 103196]
MPESLPSLMLTEASWLRAPAHLRWLDHQGLRLLDFSKASRLTTGFGPLDHDGRQPPDAQPDTTLTARMTHVYAIAGLRGLPGCLPLAEHGVYALLNTLQDARNGGWFGGLTDGKPSGEQARKQNYLHAFIALAASSAVVAAVPAADQLLERAANVWAARFWSESEGVFRESFDADWSDEEDYRGANSNMHSVEACMALADVTGDAVWRRRALRVVERFIHTYARASEYKLHEHYDRSWTCLADYNRDEPTHPLRPYGMTPGHFLEWSHLLLQLEAALLRTEGSAPSWLLEDSIGLFDSGISAGWARNGTPGVLYTVDENLVPVVENRPHWCQAETLIAAAALLKRTGHPRYETWYRTLWNYIDLHMIDRRRGGWIQEVDADNQPSAVIYPDKSDLYHAWQSTLAPLVPLAPSFASAVRELG